MNLPPPIAAYFKADRSNDAGALVRAFVSDAVVRDEGQSHVGHEAIVTWWRAAKAKYKHVAEPLDLSEQDSMTKVRAMVIGQFPGSPTTLTFAFLLAGDQIKDLEIGA